MTALCSQASSGSAWGNNGRKSSRSSVMVSEGSGVSAGAEQGGVESQEASIPAPSCKSSCKS